MRYDEARLSRLLRNEADSSGRRRLVTVLEYLNIEPGDRVLDCGCGLGWFLKVAGELYDCRLFGVDPDRARLGRAARELGDGSRLVVGSGNSLPFSAGAFDKIVLSEVLEHVADDASLLREVHRVLRPGGIVAVTVPNRHYPLLWDPINWSLEHLGFPPVRRGMFGGIWTDHLRLYGRQDLVDLVRAAGFAVDDTRPLVHYCLPFSHNLVYGLGKPLVESGMLPRADRFRSDDNSGSRLNPLNWVLGLVNAIDRNDRANPKPDATSVCIGHRARKGAAP
jgi:SAM-dependent methyltransferase